MFLDSVYETVTQMGSVLNRGLSKPFNCKLKARVSDVVAASIRETGWERKVRASQSRMPANGRLR